MVARRQFVALGAAMLAAPAAFAQQPHKVWRIGLLYIANKEFFVSFGAQGIFLQGMHDHGYAPGKDFVFEERFADGDVARLPVLAAELVRSGVDLILTSGTQANRAAQQATATIPIVTITEADPVGNGFALSLARPGKNMTGISTLFAETIVKNVEYLSQMVPRLSRIGVMQNASNGSAKAQIASVRAAAAKIGIQVLVVDASSSDDIERGVETMQRERVQAFLALPDSVLSAQNEQIGRLALKHRLPSSYSTSRYPEVGGLFSYGQDTRKLWRQGAKFVDRIFKGAKPADLPFEQPVTFELVINMKTAQTLGIKVPQSLLLQATRLIE